MDERRVTCLTCRICDESFSLDGNGVVAAAELEAWVSAHVYCGGTLSITFAD